MGIASFILGIVSVVLVLTGHSLLTIIFGAIGFVLGIIGLLLNKSKISYMSIIGIILIIVSIIIVGVKFIFSLNEDENTGNASQVTEEEDVKNNPIIGNWLGDSENIGYFEFNKDKSFYWYQSQYTKDNNYYKGTYSITPGALQNNGKIDYGTEGHEIYTIMLYYDSQKVNGVSKERTDMGMFIVQKESETKFNVRNMMTDSFFNINKILSNA